MKLICGLGNPGRAYERHRHNIGFQIVDVLASLAKAPLNQEKFNGRIGQGSLGSMRVVLLQPQTFMNLSGQSLAAAARFYKIAPEDVLVIHDELDLPVGRLQLKAGGGTGGHNGLKSIVASLGEDAFPRLRVGVGKPEGPHAKDRVADYVLSNFDDAEQRALPGWVDLACDMARVWANEGMGPAMNRFNRKPKPPPA